VRFGVTSIQREECHVALQRDVGHVLVPRAKRLGVIIVQNPTHFDPKLKTHTMSAKAVIPVPV
jgi:hypothetical protein